MFNLIMSNKFAVYRKEHFNAAHRLNNPNWDDATNQKVFGKCNNPHYHGHNYELIVKVVGEINPETGYVIDMKELSNIIDTHVLEHFDHKNLNEDCIEFKDLNPSAENIALVIFQKLRNKIQKVFIEIKDCRVFNPCKMMLYFIYNEVKKSCIKQNFNYLDQFFGQMVRH
jgi:6-pyruvoyltetrahydropterin/6-carboxytetrahydropterin synthase